MITILESNSNRRTLATPLARRLARDSHIDLVNLSGSGPSGRITKLDVENIITKLTRDKTEALCVQSSPLGGEEEGVKENSRHTNNNSTGETSICTVPFERAKHTSIRKVIISRTVSSVRDIPCFTLTVDFKMDSLIALRSNLNRCFHSNHREEKSQPPPLKDSEIHLSINDMLIKACAMALHKVPEVNARFTDEAILYYKQINVAILVNTPTGLFVPVVRNADRKNLVDISNEVRSLVRKAHIGQLSLDDCSNGTFTLSNLGQFGVHHFSAIIDPEQACVLAVGTVEARPVVQHGDLVIAAVMTGTLSVDHRVADGVVSTHFLANLKHFIEQPLNLVL